MGRKNGKTALLAALGLVHLHGPESIQNGEIYSAANDREQAAQVFKVMKQIVEADPELSRDIRIVPSTKTLVCRRNGSFYRALSAEAGTKHGLNPTFVIFDELAQATDRELYDVLDTSFGGREEPLFVTISTQSNDPQHILSQLIDDGLNSGDPTIVAQLYAVPDEIDDERLFVEKNWYKANPALGDFLSLGEMRALAEKAKRMPAEEPKFRNLYLNQRVAPVASLISRAEWMACAQPLTPVESLLQPGERVRLALDLSAKVDLCALSAVSDGDSSRVHQWFWKPKEFLEEHSRRDFGAGNNRYAEWAKQGWLSTSEGRSVDAEDVARLVIALCGYYDVVGMAYDRWRIDVLQKAFDRLDFETFLEKDRGPFSTGLCLVPWGQGFQSMGPAVDALETEVSDRTLLHPSNPILNWNMGNAVAKMDPAGNRKIDKGSARFRIDGAVSLTMALGYKARDRKADMSEAFTQFAKTPLYGAA